MTGVAELQTIMGDRYRLVAELGAGGMATVYLADDPRHGRQVALKVLRPELGVVLGADRFLQEIRTTAALQHPHILPLLDSGTAGNQVFYSMPFVEGETLRARLIRERQLSVEETTSLLRQVADALQYAHERGVVHRDIKPENILLARGHALVADFGIARAAKAAGGERLTETGMSLGTPAYMSPEQAAGDQSLDHRADQYSLACVGYEMLTGSPPFTRVSGAAVMAKHVVDPVSPVATVRPDVPRAIAAAIERGLAKSPAARFESMTAFAAAMTQTAPVTSDLSIVVLPFANLSPEADTEFFADGLTDDVIMDLSKIRALRVISRNSAMLLKGTAKDTRTIGRDLNVRYVLEGTVRRAGNNVRVTAQLIEAERDSHLWAERYSGTLDDVLDIQEKLAGRIAEALHVILSPEEAARLKARELVDTRVRDIYHRARQEAFRFTRAGYEQARRLLAAGLEITGEHPLLRAAEAKACLIAIEGVIGSTDELLHEAARLTELVRSHAPESLECLQLDAVLAFRRGDLQLAARHLVKALAIEPRNADSLMWAGEVYICAGQRYAAEIAITRLFEVDPLNPIVQFMPGWLEWSMGDVAAGTPSWRKFHSLDPHNPMANAAMVLIEAWLGRRDEVEGWLQRLEELRSDTLIARVGIAVGRACLGDHQGAEDALDPGTLSEARSVGEASIWLTHCYGHLGLAEETLDWARNVFRLGFMGTPKVWRAAPFLAFLRDDPRFIALMDDLQRQWEAFEVPTP
jgi:serine/threonine protein kinase